MKRLLSGILSVIIALSFSVPATAAAASSASGEVFQPRVTYDLSLTEDERAAIHAEVDKLVGDVGDAVSGDGTYDSLTLVGTMLDGSAYDSISAGSTGKTIPTAYPFPVDNIEISETLNQQQQLVITHHRFEYDRKVAKLAWIVKVAKDLGFPVVVQRQADKTIYVEIGDPDAPEMIMALSHLDSPTASVGGPDFAGENRDRWVDSKGQLDPDAYKKPYIKDGWIYGAGMQDDSGPTLATLYAAKAMMEAGVPMDRRVRIVMGIYEDGDPGTPSVANTLNYMDIPYYTASPGFYDNWAYKYLNREETPIAAYTSDSRFPVIVGNTSSATPQLSMSLSDDAGKAFSLTAATGGVTLRKDDPTLKDIIYGSTNQIISRAIFTLDATGVSAADRNSFIDKINAAATAQGWLPALSTEIPKVQTQISGDSIIIEVNTGVAMEMPTPQYGKNAIVWVMHLLSKSLPSGLELKKAADGIDDLFFRGGVEGEAYIGRYMGIPEDLLRNLDNGAPNMSFAFCLATGTTIADTVSFYNSGSGLFSANLYIRSLHINAANLNTAVAAVRNAFESKGFTLGAFYNGSFSNPTLYLSHDNPLTALQIASYKASMNHDPEAFEDVYEHIDISFGQGTTGGTLASDFRNKMTAFGAVIPGNERWWHTANERMKIDSAVQMTKMMADGMQEMARYTGPAGAQFMWADIPGLNADRSDRDLLDVHIGTFKDASEKVADYIGGGALLGATEFDIPMWRIRGNNGLSITDATWKNGHASTGSSSDGVYLSLNNSDFLENTFVAPMRLEFKVQKPYNMTDADWNLLVGGGLENFSFNLLKDGNIIPLAAPSSADADKFFFIRENKNDPNIVYVSVNLAITDAPYDGVNTVIADSKTDLYKLNAAYESANGNPFPERGAIEQRGFFVIGDGEKNAHFESPDAIFVTPAMSMRTTAHNVKPGDNVVIESGFYQTKSSNAAILTYTFDGENFEYKGFEPISGVKVVNEVVADGEVKLTIMLEGAGNYDMKDFGKITLQAKEDAAFAQSAQIAAVEKGYQTVSLNMEYALRDETGEKTQESGYSSVRFTTMGHGDIIGDTNDDGVLDLIDLSNMVDWFGVVDSTHADWEAVYAYFDFNNNGEIDISDIAYVAMLIIA